MEVDDVADNAKCPAEGVTSAGASVNTNANINPINANCTPGLEDMLLDLGGTYKQCSNARLAGQFLSVTNISGGNCTFSAGAVPKIGSLDWHGDSGTMRTFHGGRVNKNGRTVNECLSASFDPRNMFCIGCETPHYIFNDSKPSTLIFSDQNFVSFLSGDPDNCIAIARLENPSLNELADLASDPTGRHNFALWFRIPFVQGGRRTICCRLDSAREPVQTKVGWRTHLPGNSHN
jgi:hypothetical protein